MFLSLVNPFEMINGTEISLTINCEQLMCEEGKNRGIVDELQKIDSSIDLMSYTNQIVIAISIFIASIAVLSAVLSAYFTRKQVDNQKKEMELRLRPWITLDGPRPRQIILKNGDVLDYDTFQKMPLEKRPEAETIVMSIPYRNGGQLIANNIKLIFLLRKTIFDKSIFEAIEEEKQILALAPNQEQSRSFVIPYSEFRKLKDVPLYVGVSISYDTEFKRAYSGIIYKITKGRNEGIDSWFT